MKLTMSQKRSVCPKTGEWVETPVYLIDGREVPYREFARELKKGHRTGPVGVMLQGTHRGWPLESHAFGVHPKQIKLAEKMDRDVGAPATEYTPTGEPVFRSRSHRRDYLKRHGIIDQHSFTGY